mgnify:CR=1 FL=1
MTYQLGVLEGDGIGPEVVGAAIAIVDAVIQDVGGMNLEWRPLPMGMQAIQAEGTPLPDRVKTELGKCQGWIMGPHDSVSYPDDLAEVLNPSGELRKHFGLYANVRPSKSFVNVINGSTGMNNTTRLKLEPFIIPRNYKSGFSLKLMAKDVEIASDIIRNESFSTPLSDYLPKYLKQALANLYENADHTALYEQVNPKRDNKE